MSPSLVLTRGRWGDDAESSERTQAVVVHRKDMLQRLQYAMPGARVFRRPCVTAVVIVH